jgi:hypothetical protein
MCHAPRGDPRTPHKFKTQFSLDGIARRHVRQVRRADARRPRGTFVIAYVDFVSRVRCLAAAHDARPRCSSRSCTRRIRKSGRQIGSRA